MKNVLLCLLSIFPCFFFSSLFFSPSSPENIKLGWARKYDPSKMTPRFWIWWLEKWWYVIWTEMGKWRAETECVCVCSDFIGREKGEEGGVNYFLNLLNVSRQSFLWSCPVSSKTNLVNRDSLSKVQLFVR